MRRCALAIAIAGLALAAARSAAADPPEMIAVVSADPAFTVALGDALLPAGMVVAPTEATAPALDELAARGREIADREHASAAVWLIAGDAGTTLVTYDRGVDRLLVRAVPFHTPLDAAQGAEVARMARTMLRALRVTPEIDLPPPKAAEAPAIRAEAARAALAPKPATPPPPPLPAVVVVGPAPATLGITGTVAARIGGPAATVDPALAVGAIWHPDGLGVLATARYTPRGDRMTATFTGTIDDASVGLGARYAWRPLATTPRFEVAATLGGTLHRTLLVAGETSIARLDPAATAGFAALYDVGGIGIGLGVSADWLLRRQKYDLGADEVLAIPPLQLVAGLVILGRIL